MKRLLGIIIGIVGVFCGLFVADILSGFILGYCAVLLKGLSETTCGQMLFSAVNLCIYGAALFAIIKLLNKVHESSDNRKAIYFRISGIVGTALFLTVGYWQIGDYNFGSIMGGTIGGILILTVVISICNAIVNKMSPKGTDSNRKTKWIVTFVVIIFLSAIQLDAVYWYFAGFLVILSLSAKEENFESKKLQQKEKLPFESKNEDGGTIAATLDITDCEEAATSNVRNEQSKDCLPVASEELQLFTSKDSKKRYCKFCGNEVDRKTHRCVKCGKSTNPVAAILGSSKFKTVLIFLLTVALVGTNAYHIYINKNLKDQAMKDTAELRQTRQELNKYFKRSIELEKELAAIDNSDDILREGGEINWEKLLEEAAEQDQKNRELYSNGYVGQKSASSITEN